MGMSPLISFSKYDGYKPVEGNPVPTNFKIVRTAYFKDHVVVKVYYPNCKNYEGNKILVMHRDAFDRCIKSGNLDPHFSEKNPGPLARFEPTDRGWIMACQCASNLLVASMLKDYV